MPSLKEIKNRIASVQSTRKITSAMKMVASSKLHHAQTAIQNMLPYENCLEHILKSFLISAPDVETEFGWERKEDEIKSVALVVYSSNSSLCGGYNNNVIRKMQQTVEGYKSQGISKITIYPVGRKVAEKVKKLGYTSAGDFIELADKPNAAECKDIAQELITKFVKHEYDKVELIYHHFKSAGSQILTQRDFLPIDLMSEIGAYNDRDTSMMPVTPAVMEYLRKKGVEVEKQNIEVQPINDDFIVEPDLETVLRALVPKLLDLMIYTALLDSNASEHAARMVAMQAATDNADELLKDLNLQYNKSRQAAITSELLDIVGGSTNN